MAFFNIRRLLVAPLVFLNFILYIVIAAIAGWALNKAIDRGWEELSYNPATFYFVIFALLAGVVGIAAKFSGAHHLRTWHHQSLAGSNAAAFIAWLLTLLAMGLAWKEISMGGVNDVLLQVLEALVIIVAVTQLLYLLGVGAGAYRGEYVVKSREPAVEVTSPPPVVVKE
ncbi:hypothetical protein GOP47_0003897 [Adiantum capillus-veneris]|uniref:Uncharacterized protein n=1 Tax=Adiantum capillus-veneris TaxID=13818 RepID=A0A9D4V6K1_ADICA|nr:hypothetical protein GOP47_0003897 [Adiantum capillus-veneris]